MTADLSVHAERAEKFNSVLAPSTLDAGKASPQEPSIDHENRETENSEDDVDGMQISDIGSASVDGEVGRENQLDTRHPNGEFMNEDPVEKQYCISSPTGREPKLDMICDEKLVLVRAIQDKHKLQVIQSIRHIKESFSRGMKARMKGRHRKPPEGKAEVGTLAKASLNVAREISSGAEQIVPIANQDACDEISNERKESDGLREKISNQAEVNLVESSPGVAQECLTEAEESPIEASQLDSERLSDRATTAAVEVTPEDSEKVSNQAETPVSETSESDSEKVSPQTENPVVKSSGLPLEKNHNPPNKKKNHRWGRMWPSMSAVDFSEKILTDGIGEATRSIQDELPSEVLPKSLSSESDLTKMDVDTKQEDEDDDVLLIQTETRSEESRTTANSALMVLGRDSSTKTSVHSDEQDISRSTSNASSSHSDDIQRKHDDHSGPKPKWRSLWGSGHPVGKKTAKTTDNSNTWKPPRPLPADIVMLMDRIMQDDSDYEAAENSEGHGDMDTEANQTSESLSHNPAHTSPPLHEGQSMETNAPNKTVISHSLSGPPILGSGKDQEGHLRSATSDPGTIQQENHSGKKSRWRQRLFGSEDHASKSSEDHALPAELLRCNNSNPASSLSQEGSSEKAHEKKEQKDSLNCGASPAMSDADKVQSKDDNDSEKTTGWDSIVEEDSIKQLMGMPQRFSYQELSIATGGFSEDSKLGQGGFGNVYQGVLPKYNIPVAVKKIHGGSLQGRVQGEKEFMAEVSIISQLRHRNLIQILGWCKDVAKGTFLLVYELMPNGSLDKALFGRSGKESACLSWQQRYNIVTGAAAALDYLHQGLKRQVIHRDIKSSNIMLDEDWNAILGDFGLARLVDHQQAAARTMVAGTPGYIAPEVFLFGRFTDKTDVFSFGVLILEVACGRPACIPGLPAQESVLVKWVWDHHGNDDNDLFRTVDKRLEDYDKHMMKVLLTVGLLCTRDEPEDRPLMRHVVQMLAGDMPVPSLPVSEPGSDVLLSLAESISMDDLEGPKTGSSSTSKSGVGELETTFAQMIRSGEALSS